VYVHEQLNNLSLLPSPKNVGRLMVVADVIHTTQSTQKKLSIFLHERWNSAETLRLFFPPQLLLLLSQIINVDEITFPEMETRRLGRYMT
jgi:hypothetical protein